MKKTLVILLAAVVTIGSLTAGFWDWATPYQGPDRDIITLVITGNYRNSRLLAELIQYDTNQPFILLPYQGASGIFFCPGGVDATAMEIEPERFAQFVSFLNPKRIIILGDERYVNAEYRRLLEYNNFSVTTYSGDWERTARDVGAFLRLPNLEKNFKATIAQLTGNYVPDMGRQIELNSDTVVTVDSEQVVR